MSHIVITGVSRGIGEALARTFVAQDHRVSGCARTRVDPESLCKNANDRLSVTPLDIADAAAVSAWADAACRQFGPPDLVINNAALLYPETPLWEIPPKDFDYIVQVNIAGTAHVVHAFAPAMIAAGRGVFVNLSSGWGRSVDAGFSLYCATKWAIEGLTKALALDLPSGLAAVALSPGVVRTAMLEDALPAIASGCVTPDHWAEKAVPWLLKLSAKDNGGSLTFAL